MNHILYDVWNELSNFPRALGKKIENNKQTRKMGSFILGAYTSHR